MFFSLIVLFLSIHQCMTTQIQGNSGIHFQLHRRGSRFSNHEPANLSRLSEVLARTEDKYTSTYRATSNNQLIRRWVAGTEESQVLDGAGLDGTWYFNLQIGTPGQSVEVDLDMLSPDFYTVITTSAGGSKYDTFMSQSHVSSQKYVHPVCRLASDDFNLGLTELSHVEWPICQASHSSRHTLRNSGTILGLAPYNSQRRSTLSRLDYPPFLYGLFRDKLIPERIWSITILDSTTGILTLGGTLAKEMEEAKTKTELELKYIDSIEAQGQIEDELKARLALLGSTTEEQFKWSDVRGSKGWWTGLIGGIWIDGIKVMKNQPFLIDFNCPFILAPPDVFAHFYNGISGTKLLGSHLDHLAVFPCLNPPRIAFELAGWQFPIMSQSNREDIFHGPAGGPFSLGKLNDLVSAGHETNASHVNSGLCVGAVVKTRMGERSRWRHGGLKGVWVLGEPFFRGLGIAFDTEHATRMGFRSY